MKSRAGSEICFIIMVNIIRHQPAPTVRQFVRNCAILFTFIYVGHKMDKLTQSEMDTFKGKSRMFGDWTSVHGPNYIDEEGRKYLGAK